MTFQSGLVNCHGLGGFGKSDWIAFCHHSLFTSLYRAMKPLCGRTIKGVIRWASIVGFALFIIKLLRFSESVINICDGGESDCWMYIGIMVGVVLLSSFAIGLLRRRLVRRFFKMYSILLYLRLREPRREIGLLSSDFGFLSSDFRSTSKFKWLISYVWLISQEIRQVLKFV